MRRLARVLTAAAGALILGLLPLVASADITEIDIANITEQSAELSITVVTDSTPPNDALAVWLGAVQVYCLSDINATTTIRIRNLEPNRQYTVRSYNDTTCDQAEHDLNPDISEAFQTPGLGTATPTPTPGPEVQIPPALQINDVLFGGDAVYVLRYNSHGETWPEQPVAVLYADTDAKAASTLTRYYDLAQRCIRPTCGTPPRGDGPGIAIIYKPDSLAVPKPQLAIEDRHGWKSDIATPTNITGETPVDALNSVLLRQLKLLQVEWGTPLTDGDHANGHGTEYLLALAPWLSDLELDVISKTTTPKEPPRTQPQRSGQAAGIQLLGLPTDTSNSLMVAGLALAGITAGSVAGKRTAGTYGAAAAIVPLSIGLLELHLPAFGLLVFVVMLIGVTLWRKTAS